MDVSPVSHSLNRPKGVGLLLKSRQGNPFFFFSSQASNRASQPYAAQPAFGYAGSLPASSDVLTKAASTSPAATSLYATHLNQTAPSAVSFPRQTTMSTTAARPASDTSGPHGHPAIFFDKRMERPVQDARRLTTRLANQALHLNAGVPMLADLIERLSRENIPKLAERFTNEYVPVNKAQAKKGIIDALQPLVNDMPDKTFSRVRYIQRLARAAKDPNTDEAKRITLMLLLLTGETTIGQEAQAKLRSVAMA